MQTLTQARHSKYRPLLLFYLTIASAVDAGPIVHATLAKADLATTTSKAPPAPLAGLKFSHHDWELACDNTRTCRAAGYSVDGADLPVSVLLTRKAGPRQPVTGELIIGDYNQSAALEKLPPEFKLTMKINQRSVGQVVLDKGTLTVSLPAAQTAALLAALSKDSRIEWTAGAATWNLSAKGAAAVLLKMDEFQGRIGTPGALLRKGTRSEDAVLPPLPAPVLTLPSLAKPQPGDAQFAAKHAKPLRKALIAISKPNDACPILTAPEEGEKELSFTRLTDTKWLVSTPCWLAAYNAGDGYWVIDGAPPYHPVLVTGSGSEYSDGSISAAHKGRGLGDCWNHDTWSWDGKQFIHTSASSTGMCKLITPGGAWPLPTFVTDMRQPSR